MYRDKFRRMTYALGVLHKANLCAAVGNQGVSWKHCCHALYGELTHALGCLVMGDAKICPEGGREAVILRGIVSGFRLCGHRTGQCTSMLF